MFGYILFGLGTLGFIAYFVFSYFERVKEERFFTKKGIDFERKNLFTRYFDRKKSIFRLMGYEVSEKVLITIFLVFILLGFFLPLAFSRPILLSAFFGLIGGLFFELGTRWYGNQFNTRFEKGLRRSMLPIGIESLVATGDIGQAVYDILELSHDKIIVREFKAIVDLQMSLNAPFEEVILHRAEKMNIPVYTWLAKYTLKLRQYGASTSDAWQDILDELEDRDVFRTMILSKTSIIRLGAYLFVIVFALALLIFYNKIAPVMKGTLPFVFGGIIVLIFVGVYRLTRLGSGDLK